MLLRSFLFTLLFGSALISLSAAPGAPVEPKLLPPPSAKQGLTYAADIQPIFAKSCYPCHSQKTPKPKGKLRLDSLEDVLKGGEDGHVVVAGDSAKSPMVIQLSHQGNPRRLYASAQEQSQHRAADQGANRPDPRLD